MKQRYKELGATTNVEINKDTSEDSLYDSDFDPGEWFERKPFQQKVTAEIPIDVFAGNEALMATINDTSPSILHKVTGAILAQSGADLTDFKCSQSTVARKMKYVNHNICMISKEDVQQAINESPYPCIVHFDGETLIELNKGKTIKTDRLAVLVNIEGETHLLGEHVRRQARARGGGQLPPLPWKSKITNFNTHKISFNC